ncbi:MAG: hypothetical protein KDK54_08340, partial [Leptospiraceae bacterium]|nr:hypothetical protein [Leptospiraceae bacterium]
MNKIILFLLFLLSFPITSKETEFIEWKPIKGAFGYLLEVRDSRKKTIIKEKVKGTTYSVAKLSGNFEFRVSPLNLFEKPTVWSKWSALNIIVSRPPLLKESSVTIDISELSSSIPLDGKNFIPETKVSVLDEKGEVIKSKFKYVSNKRIDLSIVQKGLKKEKLSLLIENPKKNTKKFSNFIVLTDKETDERLAREKAEAERLEKERLAKLEAERLEKERLAKLEAERLAKEKAEKERLEKERLAKLEAERLEKERLAKLEAERLAKEKAEKER